MLANLKDIVKRIFKPGETVTVVTEDDKLLGGKIILQSDGTYILRKFNGQEIPLWLSEMRFIGQDGFEIRKLTGADGSSSIMFEDNIHIPELIRKNNIQLTKRVKELERKTMDQLNIIEKIKSLEREVKGKSILANRVEELERELRRKDMCEPERTRVFGDPFMVDGVIQEQIYNIGRSGPGRSCRRDPMEEFVLMSHKNGAKAILQDLHTVYYAN